MAKQESLRTSECPVARTLESIGERWCMMIVREAFDDVRRFSDFQRNLGLAKNILASRLKQLVETGVFEIAPASDGSAYNEYLLTDRGRALFPVVVAMRQWGERYLFEKGETHSVLLDNAEGKPLPRLEVCSSGGQNWTRPTVIASGWLLKVNFRRIYGSILSESDRPDIPPVPDHHCQPVGIITFSNDRLPCNLPMRMTFSLIV